MPDELPQRSPSGFAQLVTFGSNRLPLPPQRGWLPEALHLIDG